MNPRCCNRRFRRWRRLDARHVCAGERVFAGDAVPPESLAEGTRSLCSGQAPSSSPSALPSLAFGVDVGGLRPACGSAGPEWRLGVAPGLSIPAEAEKGEPQIDAAPARAALHPRRQASTRLWHISTAGGYRRHGREPLAVEGEEAEGRSRPACGLLPPESMNAGQASSNGHSFSASWPMRSAASLAFRYSP